MRVCIIEVTGSLRPHKADSVNPLFFLPKIENLIIKTEDSERTYQKLDEKKDDLIRDALVHANIDGVCSD